MNKNVVPVILAVFTFALVSSPHASYFLPLHADEWHSILEAKRLVRGQYDFSSRNVLELGYHAFLASLSLSFDLVAVYMFLPGLFAALSSITLFLFVLQITGRFRAAVFSMALFASLPSNTNLLGLWFAVPLTFAIPLVYAALSLFLRGITEQNKLLLYFFSAMLLLLFFIHPISGILVFIVSSIYTIIYHRVAIAKSNLSWALVVMPVTIICAACVFMLLLGKGPSWMISNLVFSRGWTPLEPDTTLNAVPFDLGGLRLAFNPYFPPLLFGILPFIVALYGLHKSLADRRAGIICVWAIYCAMSIFLFVNFDFLPLIPYQRMVYYLLLSLVPIAGIGLDGILEALNGRLRGVLLASVVLIAPYLGYGSSPPGMEIYHIIDDSDYAAIKILAAQPPAKVMASPEVSAAIAAMSAHDVVADMVFIGGERERNLTRAFFASDCKAMSSQIKELSIGYVFSRDKIHCAGMRQIPSQNRYIYDVR